VELKILIIIHTIAACVWIGGHLILAITVLPKAWKDGNADPLLTNPGAHWIEDVHDLPANFPVVQV